jgi:pimeloyl-ACP methyl ester carboxylesterase
MARWLLAGTREPFSLNGIILRDYLDCGLRAVVRTYAEAVADRMRDELPHVHSPALVIRGERDSIATPAWAAEVAERLHAKLVVVPGASHTMNYASPDALARIVGPFLAGEAS